jgi:hypothetical protein
VRASRPAHFFVVALLVAACSGGGRDAAGDAVGPLVSRFLEADAAGADCAELAEIADEIRASDEPRAPVIQRMAACDAELRQAEVTDPTTVDGLSRWACEELRTGRLEREVTPELGRRIDDLGVDALATLAAVEDRCGHLLR